MSAPPAPVRRSRAWLYVLLILLAGCFVMVYPLLCRVRESARLGGAGTPGVAMVEEYDAQAKVAAGGGGGSGPRFRLAATAPPGSAETAPGGFQAGADFPSPTSPMLIRTGSLRLRVDDVVKAHDEVARIAEEAGGYVATSTVSSETGPTFASITIRVPAKGLDSIVEEIVALGKLLNKEITTQEVTEEYVDLTSRRRNLEREEEQLLALLKRAGKVSDLLQVEQVLGRIRGEIEQISGRMRFLENRVAYSTLSVNLEGPEREPTAGGPAWAASDVGRRAVRSLLETARGLASAAIWLGVYAAIWLPLLLILLWIWRRASRAHRAA